MILVTGGAGYIGSHIVSDLLEKGKVVLAVDNLSSSESSGIKKLQLKYGRLFFLKGDLNNLDFLNLIFSEFKISGVFHFAGKSLTHKSLENPLEYYENNLMATLNLLKVMKKKNVKRLVFSSTAEVYGNPKNFPIEEDEALNPVNTYGRTKLMIENILKDFGEAYGLKYFVLRYFNAAGADLSQGLGEQHLDETHLIPRVCQYALGKREGLIVNGDDYDTFDGTCVRDYVHVKDLAEAHVMAYKYLRDKKKSEVVNLGSNEGYSVLEIIKEIERISGRKLDYEVRERRKGDIPVLVASNEKAKRVLGWEPKYKIGETLESAFEFQKNLII